MRHDRSVPGPRHTLPTPPRPRIQPGLQAWGQKLDWQVGEACFVVFPVDSAGALELGGVIGWNEKAHLAEVDGVGIKLLDKVNNIITLRHALERTGSSLECRLRIRLVYL